MKILSEETKNEELVEEVEAAEETVAETPEKSELDLANERAEEFENKYLRAHAEMQNIQRRAAFSTVSPFSIKPAGRVQ